MIRIEGPAFKGEDSRVWSLELVKRGFTVQLCLTPKESSSSK